jgi:hypothetical protein
MMQGTNLLGGELVLLEVAAESVVDVVEDGPLSRLEGRADLVLHLLGLEGGEGGEKGLELFLFLESKLLGLEDAVQRPGTPGKDRDEHEAGNEAHEPLVGGSLVHHHDCGCGLSGFFDSVEIVAVLGCARMR